MSTTEPLTAELAIYEQQKAELLKHGEGRFALIGNGNVAGVWDTYDDALQAGYEKFGLKPFLVKQIASREPVQFISRTSPICP
ncbi:MAG TPA: hypothetical protein VHV55_04325 [Pirellulales bacterium]|nr:hypothetical protein [Pirellulales bacterium]